MSFFVYVVQCSDKTYYTGCTNNVEKRIVQHNNAKNGAHYTKIRRPVVLKYVEHFDTLLEARGREAAIKKLTREQKKQLISQAYDQ
jgi:putative endonuclease